jgi:F-box and WD-40 domain protein CDC4
MANREEQNPSPAQAMESEEDTYTPGRATPAVVTVQQVPSRQSSKRQSHPKPPPTPNSGVPASMPQSINNPLLPSAPASPPTPAPSPTPHQRSGNWAEQLMAVDDHMLRDFRMVFNRLDTAAKEAWLEDIVDSCDNHMLSFLHQLVSPRLKKDPFQVLPTELSFRVSVLLPRRTLCANMW